jgi:hypothetical protein
MRVCLPNNPRALRHLTRCALGDSGRPVSGEHGALPSELPSAMGWVRSDSTCTAAGFGLASSAASGATGAAAPLGPELGHPVILFDSRRSVSIA